MVRWKSNSGFAALAGLVRGVAGVASHVERGVTAAFFGNIESLFVAAEAKILLLVPRCRFQQLILVVAGVRIVALQAIAHRGRMHRALELGRIFSAWQVRQSA